MKCVVAKEDEIEATIVKWKNILFEILFKVQRNYKSKKTTEAHIFLRKKCKNTFLTHNKSVNKGICTALSSLIMVMLL